MSRILVINPDTELRKRAVELLDAGSEWDAEPSGSVAQALDQLHAGEFQLVVADRKLAVEDDHKFLKALLKADPLRPVLLTGSDGTVEQVVEALQAGADGFVHTDHFDIDLLDNVERVINSAHRSQTHAKLLDCMTSATSTFAIENDPLMLPTLLTRLQNSVTMFDICDAAERTRLGIALEEALSNALYHGNLEVSSDLRTEDIEAYYELAGQRRETGPYRDRRIYITEILDAESATFVIRDEGPGFDTSKLDACTAGGATETETVTGSACPDGPDDEEIEEATPVGLEALSGRGLLLMKSFVDEVRYNAVGNEVTLVKRKKPEGGGLTLAA